MDEGGLSESGFVGDGEFSEISSDHIEFDLDFLELFPVIDPDDSTDHLGEDESVPEVGLDSLGSFSGREVDQGGSDLLDQISVLSGESS